MLSPLCQAHVMNGIIYLLWPERSLCCV